MARTSKAGIKEPDDGVDQGVPPPLAFRSGASQSQRNSRQDGGDGGSERRDQLRRDHANNSAGISQGRRPTCRWRQSSNDH
jgi:hypothetical protein